MKEYAPVSVCNSDGCFADALWASEAKTRQLKEHNKSADALCASKAQLNSAVACGQPKAQLKERIKRKWNQSSSST